MQIALFTAQKQQGKVPQQTVEPEEDAQLGELSEISIFLRYVLHWLAFKLCNSDRPFTGETQWPKETEL